LLAELIQITLLRVHWVKLLKSLDKDIS
jgi:hypothetical protein